MADTHSIKVRSYNMSRIRSIDSKPEIKLRKELWRNGIRGYRLHKKITGKPDLVFAKSMVAVFVDGCFWHHCPTCFVRPKSNNEYWDTKIARNVSRDVEVVRQLSDDGYKVIRLWEHDVLKSTSYCTDLIARAIAA
jgi:DNA mismatch endonuclease (patch repair protein)